MTRTSTILTTVALGAMLAAGTATDSMARGGGGGGGHGGGGGGHGGGWSWRRRRLRWRWHGFGGGGRLRRRSHGMSGGFGHGFGGFGVGHSVQDERWPLWRPFPWASEDFGRDDDFGVRGTACEYPYRYDLPYNYCP